MKKKLIMGTKVLSVLFIFLLIIFIAYAMSSDSEEINVSSYVGIPFIVITILTIVSFSVMFVCELIELVREKNKKAFIDILGGALLLSTLLYLYDYVIEHNNSNITFYLLWSFLIVCFLRTLNYWKRV